MWSFAAGVVPAILSIAALLSSAPAAGQAYPAKPVKLVIPFAAGSATDTVGRVFGQKMSDALGQPVVVENRPGANGVVAADAVAKSAPDGYTLLVGTNTTNAAIRMLMKNVPYDPAKDFTPISFLGVLPQVVCVAAESPHRTLTDLIAFARANPEKISYAWANASQRVSSEMLSSMTGARFFNVPYKSSPQAVTDLMSGQIQMYIADMIVAMPQIKAGRIRALAVTSPSRSSVFPEVPTVAEAGNLPGYQLMGIFAVFGPAGLPVDVVSRVNAAIQKAAQDPDLRTRMGNLGLDVQPSTPEELGARFREETARWTKAARDAGIQPE